MVAMSQGRCLMEGWRMGWLARPRRARHKLDVLDKELEKRGRRFVRYADECAATLWPGSRRQAVRP
jgi:hypothetical protein